MASEGASAERARRNGSESMHPRFLLRHAVWVYFALTFVISWGGILLVTGGPQGIPADPDQVDTLLPLAVLAILGGPSVAGVALTILFSGRHGLRDLLSRLIRWRASARWYAVAILTAPAVMLAILLPLSLLSSEFLLGFQASEDKTSLLLFGISVAIAAGFFEELGWTGFATPRLRRRHGVLSTGLIIGLVWAAWHVLPAAWLSGVVSGELALVSYLLDPFLFLVAFRVLMVWVYERTHGSLLVAMLMHMSLTGSARIIGAQEIAGVPLMAFDFVWFAVMCVVVAMGLRRYGSKRRVDAHQVAGSDKESRPRIQGRQ